MNQVKPSSNAVKIDPRRLDQLKLISSKLGTTNAGMITRLIREHVAAGTIPADIPGFGIEKVSEGVSISVDDKAPGIYDAATAREIVDHIRNVVAGRADGVINLDHHFAIARQGTGFALGFPFPGSRTIVRGDIAEDVADLIEKAIV